MKIAGRFLVGALGTILFAAGPALAQNKPVVAMKIPAHEGGGSSGTSGNVLYCDPFNNAGYGFISTC